MHEEELARVLLRIRENEVEFVPVVESLIENEEIFQVEEIDSLLHEIQPAVFAPAFTVLLSFKAQNKRYASNPLLFLSQFNALLSSAHPDNKSHFPPVAKHLAKVCRGVTELLVEWKRPKLGISQMFKSIQLVQSSSDQLTPIHSYYIKLCLTAKCYSLAHRLTEIEIYEIDHSITSPSDFLLYCYYSALVFIGLKQLNRALDLLVTGLSIPAQTLSAIMIESYKRYILISLIHAGEVEPLPKYISPSISQKLRYYCQTYVEFSTIYSSLDYSSLSSFILAHSSSFLADKTRGLVEQCFASLRERKIQKITKCFMTLSLSDISTHVELPPAATETALLHMIDLNLVSAKIHQNNGMVSFEDTAQSYNTNDIRRYLHHQIAQSMHLTQKLKLINESNQLQVAGKKKKKMPKGMGGLLPQHSALSFSDDLDLFEMALIE